MAELLLLATSSSTSYSRQTFCSLPQARSAAAATLLPELHCRWPRLALIPSDALLQLLEQLPATLRAAAAGQPVELPLPLLDVLFRGVTCLLPSHGQSTPSNLGAQTSTACTRGLQTKQLLQGAAGCQQLPQVPPVAPESAGLPTSAASLDIRSRGGDRVSTSQQQQALQLLHTVSGSLDEPLSAAEVSAAGGAVGIHALACNGVRCTAEFLPLCAVHSQQQQQLRARGSCSSSDLGLLDEHGSARGVIWAPETCPVAMLQRLHASAAAALRQQTHQAMQSAGTMRVGAVAQQGCTSIWLCRAGNCLLNIRLTL